MGDSLIDDVVREVFDIDHVFPVEFLKEEKKHEGFWSRLWNSVRNAFGVRRSTVAPRDHKQGAADEGGSRPGPDEAAGCRGVPDAKGNWLCTFGREAGCGGDGSAGCDGRRHR